MVAVDWAQFKLWLKSTLPALGGPGLLLSAFIDSSFVPLPLVTDLALMALSSRHPMRMPYYAGMASLGSLAGCIVIYHLARKGGLAYYRGNQGLLSDRIRRFMQEHPMACVFFSRCGAFPHAVQAIRNRSRRLSGPFWHVCRRHTCWAGLSFFPRRFFGGTVRNGSKADLPESEIRACCSIAWNRRVVPVDQAHDIVRTTRVSGRMKLTDATLEFAGNFVCVLVRRKTHRWSDGGANLPWPREDALGLLQNKEPIQTHRHDRYI